MSPAPPDGPLLGDLRLPGAGQIQHPPGHVVNAQLIVCQDQLSCFVFSGNHRGHERCIFLWEETRLLSIRRGRPSVPAPRPRQPTQTAGLARTSSPLRPCALSETEHTELAGVSGEASRGGCPVHLLESDQDSSPRRRQQGLRLTVRKSIIESPRAGAGGLHGSPTNCLAARSVPSGPA